MFYIPSNNNDGSDPDSDCDSKDDHSDDNDDRDPDNDCEEEDENVERFKRIYGYDNSSVSNHDRVRNDTTNHILKPGKDRGGYHRVNLRKNGKGKNHSVHRLVGLTFIPNRDDKPILIILMAIHLIIILETSVGLLLKKVRGKTPKEASVATNIEDRVPGHVTACYYSLLICTHLIHIY